MHFLNSARLSAAAASLILLAACGGGGTVPATQSLSSALGTPRQAMNNGNGVETPPNCTFDKGITTCATTTTATSTNADGPTCTQTVTTTTTTYTAHHGKDPHGEELPAPPSTVTTTYGDPVCPTNTASIYKTNFFRPACGQSDRALNHDFSEIGTVSTQDEPNGDVKVHIQIQHGDANADYIAAETCVTFLSPHIHTDASGVGGGDFIITGGAGQSQGFDIQVTTPGGGLVWYDSAQTGLFTI